MNLYSNTSSDIKECLRRYKYYATPFSRNGDAVFLAILLVFGIIIITPILSSAFLLIDISQSAAVISTLFVVVGCYSITAIVIGRPVLGGCVALLVMSTVAANIPLADTNAYPSNIGPNIWLVFLPLTLLVTLLILNNPINNSINNVEYIMIGLVIWLELGALFGNPIRPDVAVYTGLYFLVNTIAFGILYRYIKLGVISLKGVFFVFLIAGVGHAIYALAQFFNQGSFGISVLGEVARSTEKSNAVLSTPFGKMVYGLYISGFTGGSAPLSVFLTLLIPITIGYFLGKRDKTGKLGIGIISLLCVALFLTAKESALLGLLAAATVFGILLLAMKRIKGTPNIHLITIASRNIISDYINRIDRRIVVGIGSIGLLLFFGGIMYFRRLMMRSHSVSIRFRQYLAGIRMTIDHPLFGVGGGNYAFIAPEYGLPSHLGGGGLFPIHSMYIGIFAEAGLLGGILLLLAIGIVLRAAIINWQKQQTIFSVGIVASVVAYSVVAFWVTPLRYTNTVPFWMISGSIIAYLEQTTD